MIIAFPAESGSINSMIAEDFGSAKYFIVVDTSSLRIEPFSNPSVSSRGGFQVQLAMMFHKRKVKRLVCCCIDRGARAYLESRGLEVAEGSFGKVRDAAAAVSKILS